VLRVVVAQTPHGLEHDGAVALQPVDHLGGGVHEHRGQLGVDQAVGQRLQVGEDGLAVVGDAGLDFVPVERQPGHASRPRGGAPDGVGLLEQPHRGPVGGGPQRGGQPGGPRAQHDDVVLLDGGHRAR
jgi:hypothetical protein